MSFTKDSFTKLITANDDAGLRALCDKLLAESTPVNTTKDMLDHVASKLVDMKTTPCKAFLDHVVPLISARGQFMKQEAAFKREYA